MIENRGAFKLVAAGMDWVYYGLCLLIITVLLSGVGQAVARANRDLDQFVMVITLTQLGIVASRILDLLGCIRCLAIPASTHGAGRSLILCSAILTAIAVVITIAAVAAMHLHFDIPRIVAQLQFPIGLLGLVLFMLFLRSLGLNIGRPDIASSAITVLILMGALLVGIVGLVVMSANLREGGPPTGHEALIGLGLFVLGLVALGIYGKLLHRTAAALRTHSHRTDLTA